MSPEPIPTRRYTYSLGSAAGALVESGATGLMATVGGLAGPAAGWTVGGTPLTGMMCIERCANFRDSIWMVYCPVTQCSQAPIVIQLASALLRSPCSSE